MTVARFFVDADLVAGAALPLPAAVAHHATRVLRLRDRAPIVLFNGRGGEFAARLRTCNDRAFADIESFDPIERESPLQVTLIQALIANEKLDWVIEKAVELGVARVMIAPAARSVVRLSGDRLARRREHWREIAVSACCQCGRNRLPVIDFAASIERALAAVEAVPQRLVLAPGSARRLSATQPIATCVAVGPEGAFSEAELRSAEALYFTRASWGPRVLRTETAGLAALAALQTLHGDCARASS